MSGEVATAGMQLVTWLTDDERTAIRLAGELSTLVTERVCGYGATRTDDVREIEAAIHVIQRAVMAQAAARAYPGELRLLGEVLR